MQGYLEVQMSEVWFRYLQSVLGNAYQADIGACILLILEHLCGVGPFNSRDLRIFYI